MHRIHNYNMIIIKPGTVTCSTAIELQHPLRLGGCALCMLAARTVFAVSTLLERRVTTTLAVPLGSPRPSVPKFIGLSPLSCLRRKPGQIMSDKRSNQVERKEGINEGFTFAPWLCWSG